VVKWSEFLATEWRCIVFPVKYEVMLYSICYVEESRPPLWSSGQNSWLHNGNIFWFLCCTNWICVCYVEEIRPPLWSNGQSAWVQLQKSGLYSRRYHIFWEIVVLKRCPFSPVSITEELLGRKSSGSGLGIREYGCREPSSWQRGTLSPQKLALTSSTTDGRSVGIVRLRTKSMQLVNILIFPTR
jgi:hypothetical protein